jgi:hypothetical protein
VQTGVFKTNIKQRIPFDNNYHILRISYRTVAKSPPRNRPLPHNSARAVQHIKPGSTVASSAYGEKVKDGGAVKRLIEQK